VATACGKSAAATGWALGFESTGSEEDVPQSRAKLLAGIAQAIDGILKSGEAECATSYKFRSRFAKTSLSLSPEISVEENAHQDLRGPQIRSKHQLQNL
jgi:hypothetical protein